MGHPRIETLPVFRHGGEAARICDEALSVMGPTDSRISRSVLNVPIVPTVPIVPWRKMLKALLCHDLQDYPE